METWSTLEELAAARERFAAALPGWRAPAVHALGTTDGTTTDFLIVNEGAALTAVVLSTVCGHRRGSASYELTEAQLDEAIALQSPASACQDVKHPNLAVWRELRSRPLPPGHRIVVVFLDDDPQVERLRARLTE
ncbi:hypothetical protein GCM10027589_07000 [Actinocorallia lasiicapitis]